MLYWTGYYNKCSISSQKRGTYFIMKQKISLLLACIFIVLAICGCETQPVQEPTIPPTEPPTEPKVLTLDDEGGSEVRGVLKLTNMGLVNGEPNFVKGGLLIDHFNDRIKLLDLNGNPTDDVRFNPNNSVWAIEGITSPDGRVLGKMGHSERVGDNLYRNVEGNYNLGLFDSAFEYYK